VTTLFISDLHLDASRPRVIQLFAQFLQQHAGQIDALYILGDLFEAWIGDDAGAAAAPVVGALRAFSQRGTPLFVMHGNRDFLLGSDFAHATNAALLPETHIIDLYGTRTLLMHGDTLCTDDTEYQNFRLMVRNPQWQQAFLAKPIAERIALAQQARSESRDKTKNTAEYIMDANPDAVVNAMCSHNVRHLIHGHTHRPAIHSLRIDGDAAYRYVLGDWYDHGSMLVCQADRPWQLEQIPLR
jgi:UDP-2,3-diacylglucosamine hydrolase